MTSRPGVLILSHMFRSWRIGTLLGFPIEVAFSFLLLLGVVLLWMGGLVGLFVVGLAFSSVLLHELGVALVQRDLARLEGHSADRTATGLLPHDLRVHRTRPLGGHGRCRDNGLERHPALRACARAALPYLRMHGAGVRSLGCVLIIAGHVVAPPPPWRSAARLLAIVSRLW